MLIYSSPLTIRYGEERRNILHFRQPLGNYSAKIVPARINNRIQKFGSANIPNVEISMTELNDILSFEKIFYIKR